MLALSPRDKRRAIFAPFLEWCYDRVRASLLPLDREHFTVVGAARGRPDAMMSAVEVPDLARCCYDASLLFRRMERLQIDRDELAKDDPLLFRELQGLCTLCRSKEQCARDLAADFDDMGWEEYCPNATTLNNRSCAELQLAAQHLKRPRST